MFWPQVYYAVASSSMGIPVKFEIPEDYWGDTKITYEVHTNCCTFMNPTQDGADIYGDTHNTVGMKRFYAHPGYETAPKLLAQDIGLYIDAVVRADGTPVGYAVIELGYDKTCFFMLRTEVVVFPLLDGEFQPVTEEYIQKCITKAEEERTKDYSLEGILEKFYEH